MADDKKVILVTGSCGRIGAAVVKRLGSQFRMVGFELLKAFYASTNEELVPCDISSDESVHQALSHIRHFYGTTIHAVIHLAAYYSFSEKESPLYQKITIEGTRRLLRGLQNFQVGQFIFSSTMLIHAPCKVGTKITENSPLKATWGYPKSKVETERIIREERGSIPTVILRVSGVYDDECHSIPLSQQIQRIYEHQINAHLFAGNMEHGADFIHMEDLVNAIVSSIHLKQELANEEIFLIGEGKTLSYRYLQKRISSLLFNKTIKTYSISKSLAKLGAWIETHTPFFSNNFIQPWMINLADDHYDLDISKAKAKLKWQPQHSLDKTLPIMINLLKYDPVAWYKKNGLHLSHNMKKQLKKNHDPTKSDNKP